MQRILSTLLFLALLAGPLRAAEPPTPAVDAEAVTRANLPAHERFWPYRVALTKAWKPPDREKPLPAGSTGILIRVESSGAARIDFAADGKYEVPVDHTDVVESANRIRRGELGKQAPNFTWAIATRLVDSSSEKGPVGLNPDVADGRPGFLCVFADPQAEGFERIAAGLAPLQDRHGVLTIFFPQGLKPVDPVFDPDPDIVLWKRLRALGWKVPFLFSFLSDPYTRTLLPEETPLPALLLQTNEGRIVFQSGWRADVVPELTAALDATFGAAPAAMTAGGPVPEEMR